MLSNDVLLNISAIRCFRDVADGDYIAARLSYRAGLMIQFLWSSQQTIEKYLKCILLLNRIHANDVGHNLELAVTKIEASGRISLALTNSTSKFIEYVDRFGQCRYLEASYYGFGEDIVKLDRAVWELRRFCTTSEETWRVTLRKGYPAEKVRLSGGYLEKIIDNNNHPARDPLLWQNGFFGKRTRKKVTVRGGFHAANSPLSLYPQIVDEVSKYVHLPKNLKAAYQELRDQADQAIPPGATLQAKGSGTGSPITPLANQHKRAVAKTSG